ncbi:MAG: tetratricopeptide repeat protein [Candidatus Krumholzibacteriota bacterium]
MTGGNGGNEISDSPEAIRLCDEGTKDLNAFRWQSAVKKLTQCLELDPTLAEASISRAFAYARLGEKDKFKTELALADSLTEMIQDDRRRMVAQLRLGGASSSIYHGMRDSVLARLETEVPENIFVLVAQAGIAEMSNDLAEVEKAWHRILEVDPNYAGSYNQLGYMELNRGNYDKAIEYMQKYSFLAPDLANPHDSLGEVLMVLGRYEEAEAEFRNAVEMQPDFYFSLINLGKTYVARGQLKTGLDILEKVHQQMATSAIQRHVDYEIVHTYLVAGLQDELARMSAIYIERYPEDDYSAIYRGMHLAYGGKVAEGRAVMDSTLAVWRESDEYKIYPKAQKSIDGAAFEFTALLADVVEDYETAAENWGKAVATWEGFIPSHKQWYPRYRWASSLHAGGHSDKSLEILDPILQINPRVINMLVLKVECHLDLKQGEKARKALEQLQWSLAKSDRDFPARIKADELKLKVDALAVGG